MVLLTELLLTVSMTTAAFALVVTPTPAPDWDKLVNESLQSSSSAREYFFVQTPSCLADCPSGWATYSRRCFKYVNQSMDWVSAEINCTRMGGNLVSIHNDNEYQVVKALIRVHDPKENPTWIGLSNCQKNKMWIWSDGTPFRYSNWNRIEPNFSNGECCVHMNWADEKNWNDIPCTHEYPFVCVKKLA